MRAKLWDAPDVVPSIAYRHVSRAVEWLERVFNFRERGEARLSWPGGGMTWLEAGNGLLNVSGPDHSWPGRTVTSDSAFVLKVYVDDVDSHYARAKAEGAEIVSEPKDGFWGGRTYRVRDLEGHRWEISQRNRDLAPEAWELPQGVRRGVT